MPKAEILCNTELFVKIKTQVWNSKQGCFSFDKHTAIDWGLNQQQMLEIAIDRDGNKISGCAIYTSGNEIHIRDRAQEIYKYFLPGQEIEVEIFKPSPFDQDFQRQADVDVNMEDLRHIVIQSIVARQGARVFRKKLLDAYKSKCAISGCTVEAVLEAAHIIPYRGRHSDLVPNGILLRADIHTLFDLGLITIDAEMSTILVSAMLDGSAYTEFHGRHLHLPDREMDRPSRQALEWRQKEWHQNHLGINVADHAAA